MAKETIIVRTTEGASDPRITKLLSEGWQVKNTSSQEQGYDAGKTCCLGCLFFPLALLGKKQDVLEYVLEKEPEKKTKEPSK